jgi:hypothetical protein
MEGAPLANLSVTVRQATLALPATLSTMEGVVAVAYLNVTVPANPSTKLATTFHFLNKIYRDLRG